MAITRLNSLAIPAGTVEPADISYPLTNFSSTGIDDNATSTAITIDSSQNVTVGGNFSATKLTALNGTLELDDNGTHNGIINVPATLLINIDSDNNNTGESFRIAKDRTSSSGGTELFRVQEDGNVGIGTTSPAVNLHVNSASDTYFLMSTSNATADNRILFRNSAGTDAGGLWYATNSNSMQFRTNSAERMRIDNSGNVGIGTTSPSSYNSIMDDLVIARSGDSGITLVSGTTSEGSIAFADGTSGADTYRGWINYNHNSNFLRFATNANVRMYIDNAGKIGVGNQNPSGSLHVTTTDSGGADVYYVAQNTTNNRVAGYRVFDENGTTSLQMQYDNGGNSASIINPNNGSLAVYLGGTAAANALDDYEEGTWTPTLSNHGGSTTGQTIAAVYTKIGNICHFQGVLTRGSGTTTGFVELGGFPFTAAGTFGHISINTASNSMIQMSSARVISGSSAFVIKDYDGDGIPSGVSGAVNICFQGSFQVA